MAVRNQPGNVHAVGPASAREGKNIRHEVTSRTPVHPFPLQCTRIYVGARAHIPPRLGRAGTAESRRIRNHPISRLISREAGRTAQSRGGGVGTRGLETDGERGKAEQSQKNREGRKANGARRNADQQRNRGREWDRGGEKDTRGDAKGVQRDRQTNRTSAHCTVPQDRHHRRLSSPRVKYSIYRT